VKGSIVIVSVVALCLAAPITVAQDICIPKPITVSAVRGTIFFGSGTQNPLSDVTVTLAPIGYNKAPIASQVTQKDGKFSLMQVPSGSYYLSVRHQAIIGLQVEVRVKPAKRSNKNDHVQIILGNNLSKTCSGSKVTVVSVQ
jgi:hypothetical protein